MPSAYLNTVATAVPQHDVHQKFLDYSGCLLPDERTRRLFRRMAARGQIEHRYSFLEPALAGECLDSQGFYRPGSFPGTRQRMAFFKEHAFSLARQALDQIDVTGTSHLIVSTCTGFYAPGLDHQIIQHYGLSPGVERSLLGFMGCYAAINALKLARHIVRSEPQAKVLVLNLELCTLHLQARPSLEEMLSFAIFADGCAAAIITAEAKGIQLESFSCTLLPAAADQITWHIGESGFDMQLSGRVPATIASALPAALDTILAGCPHSDLVHWAVHPGGRSVLDAVQEGAGLQPRQLRHSRNVLRDFGNMSSATIMFVLREIMASGDPGPGCGMAFGPGLSVESMRFSVL